MGRKSVATRFCSRERFWGKTLQLCRRLPLEERWKLGGSHGRARRRFRFRGLASVASANQEFGVPGRRRSPDRHIALPQLTVAALAASFRSANLRCIPGQRAREPNSFSSQLEKVCSLSLILP